jgi:hypothetical protein
MLASSLLVAATLSASACDRAAPTSSTEGLSATADAHNQALLFAGPGEFRAYVQADLDNLNHVLSDPQGHYNFQTQSYWLGTAAQLSAGIAQTAAAVDAEGTFFLFLGAHGSPDGKIETEDSAFGNYGYGDVVSAIQSGRNGRGAFRRLFLVISSCYSGAWIDTLARYPTWAYRELVVMTCVPRGVLCNVTSLSNAMVNVFESYRNIPGVTLGNFLAGVSQQLPQGGPVYTVSDQRLYDEPLFNPR